MPVPAIYRRKTKIVCTIGPSTSSTEMIGRLIRAGMNVARLNLAHGTHRDHARIINITRKVSQRLNRPVAILIDLPGPKYRIGRLRANQVILKNHSKVTLTTNDIEGNESLIPVNLPHLPEDIKVGDTILIADGIIQLRVLSKEPSEITCRVIAGGMLTPGRGLVVPGMRARGPFITDSLKKHVDFAIGQKPDYLAVSFASSANDIDDIRTLLQSRNVTIPIITKIERVQAVKNFDDILTVSNGIMVARGDLGVDIPLERVPLVQKEIIRKCNRTGKPVITATQMLESMVIAARPTRAEVTDVTNAIFDGTDATMLSEETSIGNHPVQAVRTMANIARETESRLPYKNIVLGKDDLVENETDELISYSACLTAFNLGAVAIVAFTQSGSTAGRVSKYRPSIPIIAITSSDVVFGRLLLYWGVYPVSIAESKSVDDLFSTGASIAKNSGLAKAGDLIVITGGVPVGVAGSTNLLKVEEIN
jgi:pyruvate kinase